ncbi:MAG: metal transporter CNNM [Gammaproteobacteria bacterium]|jgi:metal transporter CNNM
MPTLDPSTLNSLTWLGIFLCATQSALFSGLNLAFFSLNRLELEVAAHEHNRAAIKVLSMRQDANFLLTTILWGNVSINVLLALLSNSVLTGLYSFLFSTVFITLFGEILPQAYFSRHALKMASLFSPVLRFYQFLLYPVAKPSAFVLDAWLGKEGIVYLRERDLHRVLKKHIDAEESELDLVEGVGALNFLKIDDISVQQEGEPIDARSIIVLPVKLDLPIFPSTSADVKNPFLNQIHASGKKWVILTSDQDQPLLVLDADGYLRAALLDTTDSDGLDFNPYAYCHRPIVVTDISLPLGDVIGKFKAGKEPDSDEVIDADIILVWGEQKRIITGADVLGRLLKGIHA